MSRLASRTSHDATTPTRIVRGLVGAARGTPKRRPAAAPRKLSRLHKPEAMSLAGWQTALRRQFGREEPFALKNIGDQRIFSEFHVTNPKSGSTYRVVIRGGNPGSNFCSCPDFATNMLGTCKHIEFTLGRLGRLRGARAALARGWVPPYSEVYVQYGARREVRFRPRAGAPAALLRLANRYFDPSGVLRPEAAGHFEDFVAATARIDPERRCYDDALALIAQMRDAERRAARLAAAFPRGTRSTAFKRLLRIELPEYQRQAALFAARAGRSLIADDMGLGKTIEAIAAVEIMGRHFGAERTLVVCPTSLKHQWEREIARATRRTTVVVEGLRARRETGFRAETFYKVINYDTAHKDLDLIGAWAPDVVILDEAQRIKNWTTRTARCVKKIASPYAIVLTGTPLENRLEELVSIVDFVDRHRLGPTFRFLHDHQVRDEVGRVVGYRNLDRIGRTLAPILLRRRKSEVLDQLPPRLEKRFYVPMTPEQMRHHDENREVVARLVAKWRRFRFLSETDQRRLMIALQNMRMACDNTYLLDGTSDHGTKADELMTVLEECFERPGVKAVVFSQWVRMHELLARRLKERRWNHVFFHGGVESAKRKELVDRFRDDPRCRVFLSTDAGGVGLNLQHASVAVNVDLPWNPAVLEQRIGRVHRLGQTRPVQVLSFVAKGTIEEGMLGLLRFKQSLFGGVLDGGEREVFLGGDRLKRFMESVETVTTAIREPLVEKAPRVPDADAAGEDEDARAVAGDGKSAVADGTRLVSLIRTGVRLLEQVLRAAQVQAGGQATEGRGTGARPLETIHDERTGEQYLKIRMPAPDVVDRVAQSLQALLESLQQ
jgi:superfamily II DNA or RNA helicase